MATKQHLLIAAFAVLVLSIGGAVTLLDFDNEDPATATTLPLLKTTSDSALYGVFEGRIPCGSECERIKVRLTLLHDPATLEPTDYQLERIYVGQGDTRHTTRGGWSVINGNAPDRWGVAYRLDAQSPADFSTYLPIGSDVLLFLGPDLQPRVGDAAHSFTLSRTR